MIIGRDFAYGHLPKTGGDAAAVYLRQLVPGCACDPPTRPRKHDPFFLRGESHSKSYFLLGIRRLPEWTWSLMHELNAHPKLLKLHRTSDAVDPAFALSRPFADEYLMAMTMAVTITHWIRMESLLDDLLAFVEQHIGPVSRDERMRLQQLRTKRGRRQAHPFTQRDIDRLYALNPHWARIEREVY